MWTYEQRSGNLSDQYGNVIGTGYSGFGEGKNNPDLEAIPNVGPIPRGLWKIIRWDAHHADKGPIVAVLEPVGHDAHGRNEFLEHGDSITDPGNASHGCIIQIHAVRVQHQNSGDMDLTVTE